MATHGMSINHCDFDTAACACGHEHAVAVDVACNAQVLVSDNNVSCGHCQQLVLPAATVVTCIHFQCSEGIEVWTQELPDCEPVELHRCVYPVHKFTNAELTALLLSEPVGAA